MKVMKTEMVRRACNDALRTIFFLTSSLKKHTFYNLLINNILYLCVT